MRPPRPIFIIVLIFLLLPNAGCISRNLNTQGIGMLIRLGRDDKLKQKEANRETANFNRLKKYILAGKIKKGVSAAYAARKFREPIVILPEAEGEKWMYKPADADWIGGTKIYLLFDQKGKLAKWECIECR